MNFVSDYYLATMWRENLASPDEFAAAFEKAGIQVAPHTKKSFSLWDWFPSGDIKVTRHVKYFEDHKKVPLLLLCFDFFPF